MSTFLFFCVVSLALLHLLRHSALHMESLVLWITENYVSYIQLHLYISLNVPAVQFVPDHCDSLYHYQSLWPGTHFFQFYTLMPQRGQRKYTVVPSFFFCIYRHIVIGLLPVIWHTHGPVSSISLKTRCRALHGQRQVVFMAKMKEMRQN